MASKLESLEKCWVGTSMENIYHGHGPWNYDVPPVVNCRYHAVLYELPAILTSPPKPHFTSQTHHWNDDYVRMPFSEKNLFTIKNRNGESISKRRWEFIQETLLQPINSSKELEIAINTYNTHLPKFLALHNFFEEVLEEEESKEFFESLLPGIIRLALRLPEILPGNIPLLKQGSCKSISLSQLQISSLLANAFLCTFPLIKGGATTYPGINFVRLFAAYSRPKRDQSVVEKFKCICHYFRRALDNEPVGVVTFERKYIPKNQLPRWDRLEINIGNTKIHLSGDGVIEDGAGLLQVDFANKLVGGGVLAFGCVQEEIRYVICPELIISRLFTEQLDTTEALLIIGAERYSNYTGYGDTFMWDGKYQDKTPFDQFGRRRTNIVAIDALCFGKQTEQYHGSCILRDLNKAFVGFNSRLECQLPAVATGNWGCGAFRGDPKLKSLIQLMACSAARRDMVYYTFGDTKLRDSIYEMYLFLATNHVTIMQLWRYLCGFIQSNLKPDHLFSYIYQAHLDTKKKINSSPSTSNYKKVSDDSLNVKKIEVFDSNSDVIESSQPEQKIIRPLSFKNREQNREDAMDTIDLMGGKLGENKRVEKIKDESLLIVMDKLNKTKGNKIIRPASLKNQEDVLDTIDLMDEKLGEHEHEHVDTIKDESLLTVMDKLRKTKDNQIICTERHSCENMDVDEVESNKDIKNDRFVTKRKITDYFVKIDKG